MAKTGIRSERARRPAYLLSGLLKCGVCSSGFSKISQSHYGCSAARNKGIIARAFIRELQSPFDLLLKCRMVEFDVWRDCNGIVHPELL